MFWSHFKTIFKGPVDSTLSCYQVEICCIPHNSITNLYQFACSQFSQTQPLPSRIPVFFFFFYIMVFLTYFAAVTVTIFIRITRVRIVKYLLKIILHARGFLFLHLDDCRTRENLSTETSRCPSRPWVRKFGSGGTIFENSGWRFFLRN
jgi:uncharacterized membrane protein YgcG